MFCRNLNLKSDFEDFFAGANRHTADNIKDAPKVSRDVISSIELNNSKKIIAQRFRWAIT